MLAALPGVREIRSALAGGYLWLFFFWLLFDPSVGEGNFAGEPYKSAHHLGEILGPVARGAAATFVAYLLGALINEGRSAMAQLYIRARQSENLTPDLAQSRLVQRASRRAEMFRRRRVRRRRRSADLRRAFEDSSLFRLYRQLGVPPQILRIPLVFLSFAEALGALIGALGDLVVALFSLPVILLEAGGFAVLRSLIAMRTEPYKPFLTQRGAAMLRKYLDATFASGGVGLPPGIADVISDFPVIRTRLIHTSIDTVSEVDRLDAEAEFRSAIVPPLILLVGLLAFQTSAWWLLLWPVLLSLLAVARKRRRESGDLLVDALSQRVVSAPSIDSYLDSQSVADNGDSD